MSQGNASPTFAAGESATGVQSPSKPELRRIASSASTAHAHVADDDCSISSDSETSSRTPSVIAYDIVSVSVLAHAVLDSELDRPSAFDDDNDSQLSEKDAEERYASDAMACVCSQDDIRRGSVPIITRLFSSSQLSSSSSGALSNVRTDAKTLKYVAEAKKYNEKKSQEVARRKQQKEMVRLTFF